VDIRSHPVGSGVPWRGRTLVLVDVIRSATTAVTAVDGGHPCYVAVSEDDARRLASSLHDPVLAGEVAGEHVEGFQLGNSPAAVAALAPDGRPLVLLSSSGTPLMAEAGNHNRALVACFRNDRAVARSLAGEGGAVVLVGAETRGQFREEDQACCARMASILIEAGFEPTPQTREVVRRWAGATLDDALTGASARYLVRTNQLADLEFVRSHVDDLDVVFGMRPGTCEVIQLSSVRAPFDHPVAEAPVRP
jgi:2-phosphosulfolactate phosphatase